MQERQSLAINSSDTSITKSKELDFAIPQSTIATLSSGEFVGMVADNPGQRIPQKMFHAEIIQDAQSLAKEQAGYHLLPHKNVDSKIIMATYLQSKKDIKDLVESEMERLMNDPELVGLIIN